MAHVFEGHCNGAGLRIAIVVSRFNEFVTKALLDGAMDTLRRNGVAEGDVDVAWVPGAFEIPVVAARLAASRRYDAVVCLGAIIRGATPHFDHVAAQNAAGVARAGADASVPVIYGVLTTDTLEQAIERAGTKSGNKGRDAAVAAIEMATLMRALPQG